MCCLANISDLTYTCVDAAYRLRGIKHSWKPYANCQSLFSYQRARFQSICNSLPCVIISVHQFIISEYQWLSASRQRFIISGLLFAGIFPLLHIEKPPAPCGHLGKCLRDVNECSMTFPVWTVVISSDRSVGAVSVLCVCLCPSPFIWKSDYIYLRLFAITLWFTKHWLWFRVVFRVWEAVC